MLEQASKLKTQAMSKHCACTQYHERVGMCFTSQGNIKQARTQLHSLSQLLNAHNRKGFSRGGAMIRPLVYYSTSWTRVPPPPPSQLQLSLFLRPYPRDLPNAVTVHVQCLKRPPVLAHFPGQLVEAEMGAVPVLHNRLLLETQTQQFAHLRNNLVGGLNSFTSKLKV